MTEPNAFLITTDSAAAVAHPLTLETMQASVGGWIEPVFTEPSPVASRAAGGFAITGYVNEEGMLIDMPVCAMLTYGDHIAPLAGNLLVCGLDTRTGETAALTPEELNWIEAHTMLLAAAGKGGTIRAVHLLSLADLPA
jgi:hypothetical protein